MRNQVAGAQGPAAGKHELTGNPATGCGLVGSIGFLAVKVEQSRLRRSVFA